jgi:hypothetical protein
MYGQGEAQPKVWPSDEEAKELLKKFNSMLDVSSLKKTKNQEEFLHSRSVRLLEQVSKLDLENRERETLDLLHDTMYGGRPGLVGTNKDDGGDEDEKNQSTAPAACHQAGSPPKAIATGDASSVILVADTSFLLHLQ